MVSNGVTDILSAKSITDKRELEKVGKSVMTDIAIEMSKFFHDLLEKYPENIKRIDVTWKQKVELEGKGLLNSYTFFCGRNE